MKYGPRLAENEAVIRHTWSDGTYITVGLQAPKTPGRLAQGAEVLPMLTGKVNGFVRTPRGETRLRGSRGRAAHRRKIDAAAQALRDQGYSVQILIDDLAPRADAES